MALRPVFLHDGKTYPVGSLKLREVEHIESIAKAPYVELRPYGCMAHKLAYMAVFLLRDHTPEEVEAIIDSIDLEAVGAMWDVQDDALPDSYEDGLPLAEGEPSTSS